MPLSEILKTILTEHLKAKNEPLVGHPLAAFIRRDAAMEAAPELAGQCSPIRKGREAHRCVS
jgi:hypothetical protein